MSTSTAEKETSEKDMREAFEKEVDRILQNEDLFSSDSRDWRVGLETEYGVIDNFEQVDRYRRNRIEDELSFVDVEVGGSQIETRTDPINVSSFAKVEDELRSKEKKLVRAADEEEVQIMRHGTNPFVDLDNVILTDEDKYEKVPSFHDKNRHDDVL